MFQGIYTSPPTPLPISHICYLPLLRFPFFSPLYTFSCTSFFPYSFPSPFYIVFLCSPLPSFSSSSFPYFNQFFSATLLPSFNFTLHSISSNSIRSHFPVLFHSCCLLSTAPTFLSSCLFSSSPILPPCVLFRFFPHISLASIIFIHLFPSSYNLLFLPSFYFTPSFLFANLC